MARYICFFLSAVQVFLTLMIELEILCNLSAFAISSRSIVFLKSLSTINPSGIVCPMPDGLIVDSDFKETYRT